MDDYQSNPFEDQRDWLNVSSPSSPKTINPFEDQRDWLLSSAKDPSQSSGKNVATDPANQNLTK